MSDKKRAVTALIYRILGFAVSTAGVIMHLRLDEAADTGFMIRHKMAYFTIQTNILVAVLFLLLILRTVRTLRKEGVWTVAAAPRLQPAVTLYITVTMLGFWLLLAPTTGMSRKPAIMLNSLILHTVTPLLAIGDWAVFGVHGQLKRRDAFRWLLYPAVYLVFVMLYSRTIREPYYTVRMGERLIGLLYPYPFLDPAVMGPWGVAAAAAGLAVFFYLLGRLYIFLDRRLCRKK